MALYVHPEHVQTEWMLNMVCRLLGWSTPAFGGKIHRRGARALRFLRDGAADLAFFLVLLEERDLMGVGALPLVLSFKDVHQPRGVAKRAGLRSPTSTRLQG